MEVTDAQVKLVNDRSNKLRAFCTVTVDDEFVIRDIKIIKGTNGYFVAMPSRKLKDRCPSCKGKNHLRAFYCNRCGGSLPDGRVSHDSEGRPKLHADIAHPINQGCRDRIQTAIIAAYETELENSRQPGYVAASDNEDDYDDDSYDDDSYDDGVEVEEPPVRDRISPPPEDESKGGDAGSFASGIF